jgi:uncharacterized membrane protein
LFFEQIIVVALICLAVDVGLYRLFNQEHVILSWFRKVTNTKKQKRD